MAAAIGVRSDFTPGDLRRFSRSCDDPDQVRRLLALALLLDGRSRSEAARAAGVTLQIVRDWVIRFNADGPDGLISRKAPGKVSILSVAQRRALAQQVEAGPIPAAHGGRPLAPHRSGTVGVGRVRPFDYQADFEPRDARIGLPQALGPPPAPRPERGRHRRF